MRNLADVASYALDEAQMMGRDYGLAVAGAKCDGETDIQLRVARAAPEGWQIPESGKDVFAAQALPAGAGIATGAGGLRLCELRWPGG